MDLKIARHLLTQHTDEPLVKEILELDQKTDEGKRFNDNSQINWLTLPTLQSTRWLVTFSCYL